MSSGKNILYSFVFQLSNKEINLYHTKKDSLFTLNIEFCKCWCQTSV